MKTKLVVSKSRAKMTVASDIENEDACLLLAGKQHLLEINALFDAAKAGEAARIKAEGIYKQSTDVAKSITHHLEDYENKFEH